MKLFLQWLHIFCYNRRDDYMISQSCLPFTFFKLYIGYASTSTSNTLTFLLIFYMHFDLFSSVSQQKTLWFSKIFIITPDPSYHFDLYIFMYWFGFLRYLLWSLLYILYIMKADPNRIVHHLRIILSFLSWCFTVQWNLLLSIFLVNNSSWLSLTTLQKSSVLVIRLSCSEETFLSSNPVFLNPSAAILTLTRSIWSADQFLLFSFLLSVLSSIQSCWSSSSFFSQSD